MAEPPGPQHTSDAGNTASDGSSTPVELDELLARGHSPVRRVAGALAVLAALLVAAAVILYPQLPGTVFHSAAQVTPLHTSLPMPITIKSNVNYGVLKLNGQPLGAPPVRNVRLRTGRDVVTLVAAPFSARSCMVVAPITISGRGTIVNPETTCSVSVTGGQGEFDIAIPLDLSNLPPSLQSGALAAAEQTLAGIPAQTATVPAGQYYVIGKDQQGLPLARRAASPLTAAVSVSVSAPSATAPPPSEYPCSTMLCSGPTDPGLMPSRNSWLVDVAVTIQWRFTDSAGAVLSSTAFPATADVLLALTYVPASGWQLAPAQPSTGALDLLVSDVGDCDQGVQVLFHTISNLDSVEQASGGARALLRGCPIYITYAGHSEDAEFIWRFGVLLAVDDRAHKLLPQLPLAPADEIAAVGG